jgi:Flp pilus assembly protein TadG
LEPAGRKGGLGHKYSARLKNRFRVALGRQQNATQSRETQDKETGHREQGSAVVEFTFLALLLMVPLVYFIITVGQIQGGTFAVVGAADQAAKVFVAQPDAESGQAAAEQAALIALADFGHEADAAQVSTSCDPADCHAAGTAVTVTVILTVPLPFVPFNDNFRLQASEVRASSTQLVGRFR